MEKQENVCFLCTRCKQLVKLDSSFDSIDTQTVQELINTTSIASANESTYQEEDQDVHSPDSTGSDDKPPHEQEVLSTESEKSDETQSIYDHNTSSLIPENKNHESTNSFTFIGDSNGTSMETLSFKMKTMVRLFDIMSSNSELEHPLCEECTENLLEQLDKELHRTQEESTLYKKYCESLSANERDDDAVQTLTEKLQQLKAEEQALLIELEDTENERQVVKKERQKTEKQKETLEQEEERHLQAYSELRFQQLELEEEQCSAEKQLQHTEMLLKKLRKTNVFNATFHIWHQGPFGTINGFRLGRLPGIQIEWTEINAAWGQVVLLLASLAKKMGLKFKRYRLVPFGNHSYLETIDEKAKELSLHGSGGLRYLWDTNFDQAMVAFLDCLQQFKEEVERNSGFALPYRMEKGKIEDTGGSGASYSIKMQFNSEEQWTKALKFMLTNLKWGLAWVSSQFATPT
ncbi:beclin-1-like [Clavelina lepadiformis]|uniref:beclin-1-like n=1 Tax=Clavelina lepadiformis TaxID=159417 RepID=UPI0040413CC4